MKEFLEGIWGYEMTDDEKLAALREVLDTTFYMCIRYAHGRHSGAAQDVRRAFKIIKEVFPDFKLKKDTTITPPTEEELQRGWTLRDDWLDDLFKGWKDG